jgi:transposase
MILTLSQRYRIIFLHYDPEGPQWGYKKIALTLSCSLSTIKYWIHRYQEDEDLTDSLARGPKRKTTESEDSKIINLATSSKHYSTRSITKLVKSKLPALSHTTIYRRLKEAGLKYQMPLLKPLINLDHKEKRFTWALKHRDFDWSKCIFTDESTFQLFESPEKQWQSNTKRSIYTKVKHPQKLHVWGCFSYFGFGRLFFFQNVLDSKLMVHIYEKELLPSVHTKFGDNFKDWFLIEDNDPKHTSKFCKDFKDHNNIHVLPWPANSPDLNPIENVWGLLKVKIREKQPQTIRALKKLISNEWKSFDFIYCQNLVNSMENRLTSCIIAKGDHICY